MVPVGGCEVCGDADTVCTVTTDDGELDLCAGCADVLRESEGWRCDEPPDDGEPYRVGEPPDDEDPAAEPYRASPEAPVEPDGTGNDAVPEG
ncbi:hypothetical protein EF879_03490 [Micromonospora sp. HM5-17]|nr:hypothetical protein EF879_03490 [Micromonospora sp. HM5-17]